MRKRVLEPWLMPPPSYPSIPPVDCGPKSTRPLFVIGGSEVTVRLVKTAISHMVRKRYVRRIVKRINRRTVTRDRAAGLQATNWELGRIQSVLVATTNRPTMTKHHRMLNLVSVVSLFWKKAECTSTEPTIQKCTNLRHIRQRQLFEQKQRTEKEKDWLEAGDKASIKESRKRKPQEQESHYDDCGSDCTPLQENETLAVLCMSAQDDHQLEASYPDDATIGRPIDEMQKLNDGQMEMNFFGGSETENIPSYWKAKTRRAQYVHLSTLNSYLATPDKRGIIDVMEICGGAGGVSKIAIRRRLRTGKNFDIITGGELTNTSHVKQLLEYINLH